MDFSRINVDSYDKNTFGNCIKIQREELGLSIREVARRIDISAAYLSDIEKGNRYAPSKNNVIEKLIKALNISKEDEEYVYDMAYATRGCHKNLIDYLSECKNARKFLRYAKELNLTSDEWQILFNKLNEVQDEKISKTLEYKNSNI